MSDVYVLTVGYVRLAFINAGNALRAFELLADTVPVEAVSSYGAADAPDFLKRVCYVRDRDMSALELKRFDEEQFALAMNANEFRERIKAGASPVEPEPVIGEPVDAEFREINEPPPLEPSAAESTQ